MWYIIHILLMSSIYLDKESIKLLDSVTGPFKQFKSNSEAIRFAIKKMYGVSQNEPN